MPSVSQRPTSVKSAQGCRDARPRRRATRALLLLWLALGVWRAGRRCRVVAAEEHA